MTEEKRRPPPGITPLDTVVAFASRRRLRGAARLRRILRGHHEVTLTRVRTVDGLLFDLDVENVMDYAVLDHGYYEREVIDAIIRSLTPNGVLWDVGSNIGLHAITAKHLRSDATVVAFEPAPTRPRGSLPTRASMASTYRLLPPRWPTRTALLDSAL